MIRGIVLAVIIIAAYVAVENMEHMYNGGCTTDTECMEMYGGDGGPAPVNNFY